MTEEFIEQSHYCSECFGSAGLWLIEISSLS